MYWHLISTSLREIKLDIAKDLCNNGYYVIPGQKLCPKCRLTYSKSKTDIDQIEINDLESDDMITYDKEIHLNMTKESLNNTLNELDISPEKYIQ